jgi:hypothetical protein
VAENNNWPALGAPLVVVENNNWPALGAPLVVAENNNWPALLEKPKRIKKNLSPSTANPTFVRG